MSKLQRLNEFLTQRLTAAEETIVEYQEEICRSKQENERLQKLLDLVLKPEIKLHRADRRQNTISVCKDYVPHEHQHSEQEWSSGTGQEDPEPTMSPRPAKELLDSTQIKQEPEEYPEPTQTTEEQWSTGTNTPSYVESENPPEPLLHIIVVEVSSVIKRETTEKAHTDPGQITISVSKEAVHLEQQPSEQEWSPGLGQEDPEPTQTTEEQLPGTKTPSYVESISNLRLLSAVNPDSSETVYSCDSCNKSYEMKKGARTRHTRRHPETVYPCHFCLKPLKENCPKVLMRVHKGERPFSCNVCEKSFKRISHLTEHIRIHAGERPFSCRICGQHFRTRGNMLQHMKRTHGRHSLKKSDLIIIKRTQGRDCPPY